ncbi:hypothetical protein [Mesorhizobium sp.]|uniref:hypothetical protein n=1 Tax=Mesorhizobium sp. TaxID=1871066 RepID=UPI000FE87A12|nr:hypothetical protein [Mesorhizobium sp.]RWK61089.1 MAG: hypothetical protein EOR49_18450 [Mesorhizobium sp.]RWM46830.1 MAG: hypothetical protein EOR76_17125 [Mesorhizobium sp.]RWM52701.1 MAG: hypothetical protein EOR78_21265 [Mesorhizobium sp.]RWM56308.1 MAG: hypothetical protein EOR79_19020 [Mesorhizobium sp.]RWM83855.1 MAG: hypothetical protein EOR81_02685 [Mesorhizobium sp.]
MRRLLLVTAAASLAAVGVASSQDTTMSFFVTSVGSGKGADLGGLAGADGHCASLAEAAGITGKTWRAYLSTSDTDARDRIGNGPWFNAKGVKIADDVASLHSDANAITKQTALDEKGEVVNGRGDNPNRHDILTGSKPDGTKIADQTCGDWTLSGAEGAAMTGHHDRTGLDDSAAAKSWNSSHASRGGCSQEALRSTGGDGLFYCFAVN